MPVYVQFTLACARTGCGSISEVGTELHVPSQPLNAPALPTGWSESNGELRGPHSVACTPGA